MIYQGDKLIDTMYVGNKLVQQIYKGDKKIYPEPGVIPKAIKDSMVLWYDLKKQGATNENMTATPTICDLSWNGHDATCYNFAWSGMSGIGGYNINFTEWSLIVGSATETIFKIPSGIQQGWLAYSSKELLPFKCKVSGINGCAISYHYNIDDTSRLFISIDKDGIYNLPGSVINENYMGFIMQSGVTSNITIEILPEYPNALVSDGVDDYVKVSGLPILTDYTVIAKRSYISADLYASLAAKYGINESGNDGAFAFEIRYLNDYQSLSHVKSFGTITHVLDIPSEISFMTPTKYNGETISKGNILDGEYLTLFRLREQEKYMSAALYSFILFDRTLTTDEIAWVKKNMIEGDLVPSYELDSSLIDAWIFSGHTNNEAPSQIVGEKGIALDCKNFAWNEEGSGFKDGALYFDGVDDYLYSSDTPILNDYTIICKRNIMRIGWYGCIATKRFKVQSGGKNGDLFAFECNNTDGIVDSPIATASKGVSNIIQDIPLSISYQTKNSYNGFELEFNDDHDSSGEALYIGCNGDTQFISKLSLNYFALYSRSLTESEIQSEIEKLEKMWSNRLNTNQL